MEDQNEKTKIIKIAICPKCGEVYHPEHEAGPWPVTISKNVTKNGCYDCFETEATETWVVMGKYYARLSRVHKIRQAVLYSLLTLICSVFVVWAIEKILSIFF